MFNHGSFNGGETRQSHREFKIVTHVHLIFFLGLKYVGPVFWRHWVVGKEGAGMEYHNEVTGGDFPLGINRAFDNAPFFKRHVELTYHRAYPLGFGSKTILLITSFLPNRVCVI